MKSLLYTSSLGRYPFRAEHHQLVHYKQYPPGLLVRSYWSMLLKTLKTLQFENVVVLYCFYRVGGAGGLETPTNFSEKRKTVRKRRVYPPSQSHYSAPHPQLGKMFRRPCFKPQDKTIDGQHKAKLTIIFI